MRITACICFSMVLSGQLSAQDGKTVAISARTADSIKMSYLRMAAVRYPVLRQVGVSTEVIGNSNIRSSLDNDPLFNSKGFISRTRVYANIPVYQSGKNTFAASFNYLYQHFELTNTTSFNALIPVRSRNVDKTTLTASASYSRNDSILNTPVLLSASVIYITDGTFSRQRFNYMGVVLFPVKRTATTSLSLGAVILLDPSTPVPVTPIINYWHKFQSSGLELFFNLPAGVSLRKQLSTSTSLAVGTELNGYLSFININNTTMPNKSVYSSLELKSGPAFEYQLGKNVMLGIRGGILNTFSSRVFDQNEKSKDAFIKNKIGTVPFINFSISLLPFLKGFH